jgi:hypothetical protein
VNRFRKSTAVTFVPLVYQWAETTITADGTGISSAIFFHPLLNTLSSIPFIGDPWPINNTGINFSPSFKPPVKFLKADNVDMAAAPVKIF